MIRVLQIVTVMNAGGIESMLMNIYRNIDRDKVQFDFLTHRKEKGFYDDEIIQMGGRIYSVPRFNPFAFSHYKKELSLFFQDREEYSIVHSHNNAFSMYALRTASKAGVPVRIAHSHVANVRLFYYRTPVILYCKLKIKKYATHNFACSINAGKWLFGRSSLRNRYFTVINNSIDTKLFKFDNQTRKDIRIRMQIGDKFVIGHVGRFNSQKNHKFLVDIFKEVHSVNQNSILMLVGQGPLDKLIKKKVYDLGLNERVIFTGVRSDVPDLLQAMDVFLFPSLFEGLGIVALEAQAAGLPTIVSEAVPEEAYITDLIEKELLSSSPRLWAERILKYSDGYARRDTSELIKAKGYDIHQTAKWLQKFYINVYQNINNP